MFDRLLKLRDWVNLIDKFSYVWCAFVAEILADCPLNHHSTKIYLLPKLPAIQYIAIVL